MPLGSAVFVESSLLDHPPYPLDAPLQCATVARSTSVGLIETQRGEGLLGDAECKLSHKMGSPLKGFGSPFKGQVSPFKRWGSAFSGSQGQESGLRGYHLEQLPYGGTCGDKEIAACHTKTTMLHGLCLTPRALPEAPDRRFRCLGLCD